MASESVTKQSSTARTLLVVLAALLGSRLAVASPGVGVVVAGEPTLQDKVRARVETWIQQHGFAVVDKPLSADAQKTLTNCFVIEDTGCARSVVEHQSKADYLVFVRVDLASDNTIALAGYWFVKDRDAVAIKHECNKCVTTELNKNVFVTMKLLHDATGLAKGRFRIAKPPGVVVMLDGANVGATPLEADVPPGKHTVALVRGDRELGRTVVELKTGDVVDVDVPITDEGAEHHVGVLPKLLVFTGAAAVVVGGVFLYYGQKNGPDDPLVYPDATKQGAIITGVGGVALITGLVLWWRASSGASSNGPTAQLVPGGTIVGWTGRF